MMFKVWLSWLFAWHYKAAFHPPEEHDLGYKQGFLSKILLFALKTNLESLHICVLEQHGKLAHSHLVFKGSAAESKWNENVTLAPKLCKSVEERQCRKSRLTQLLWLLQQVLNINGNFCKGSVQNRSAIILGKWFLRDGTNWHSLRVSPF